MHRLSTNFVLGYHGCSSQTARKLLAGERFSPSDNAYDWLGRGIYFWQANPRPALQFSMDKRRRENGRWSPHVVGAVIDLGLCLDLTTSAAIDQLREAHATLLETARASGERLPSNFGGKDLLLRKLDCAVINFFHLIRETSNQPAVDTVSGIFVEGGPIYAGAGFQKKTHIQICVCNPSMIKGVFRVPQGELD